MNGSRSIFWAIIFLAGAVIVAGDLAGSARDRGFGIALGGVIMLVVLFRWMRRWWRDEV